ncbi:MAG: hypothetical protein RR235_07875 [Oscillospiraceae bacterium]
MPASETRLNYLKVDIGLISPSPEQLQFLEALLNMAEKRITGEGVKLGADTPDDDMLVSLYAGWLYRKRMKTAAESAMPRMVRFLLNCRIAQQKMKVTTQ